MALGKRLETVLNLVEDDATTCADVGTDHGKLAIELVRRKNAQIVYASDISKPSLKKAEELSRKCGIEDKIICLHRDGFIDYPISSTIDYAIIAGMGGIETIRILTLKGNVNVKYFILQPMQDADILREYLYKNGYKIFYDETICDHGKFYSIIKCGGKTGRAQKYSQAFFGKDDLANCGKDFIEYIKQVKTSLMHRRDYLDDKGKQKLDLINQILNKK